MILLKITTQIELMRQSTDIFTFPIFMPLNKLAIIIAMIRHFIHLQQAIFHLLIATLLHIHLKPSLPNNHKSHLWPYSFKALQYFFPKRCDYLRSVVLSLSIFPDANMTDTLFHKICHFISLNSNIRTCFYLHKFNLYLYHGLQFAQQIHSSIFRLINATNVLVVI